MLNQPILLALAIFVAAGSVANRWVQTARQAMAWLLPLLTVIGWSFFNFYGGRLNLTLVLSAFYAAPAIAGIHECVAFLFGGNPFTHVKDVSGLFFLRPAGR